MCGEVTEKPTQMHNHVNEKHFVDIERHYCIFCKMNVQCDDIIYHHMQHLRVSGFLDIDIANPCPTQNNPALLNDLNKKKQEQIENEFGTNSSSSSSKIHPSGARKPENSSSFSQQTSSFATPKQQQPVLSKETSDFLKNSQEMMNAINNPSEAKFKEFLKKIPEAKKIVIKPPTPAPQVPLSAEEKEDVASFFDTTPFHFLFEENLPALQCF